MQDLKKKFISKNVKIYNLFNNSVLKISNLNFIKNKFFLIYFFFKKLKIFKLLIIKNYLNILFFLI